MSSGKPVGSYRARPTVSYSSVRFGAGGSIYCVSNCEIYDSVAWAERARSRCHCPNSFNRFLMRGAMSANDLPDQVVNKISEKFEMCVNVIR